MNTTISILMSIFNEAERYICESVESILSQTLKDFELIVVNDNPDRTDIQILLNKYHDPRIKFFQNDTNIGLAMCMNKAAAMAIGNIFVRMDADDIAEHDRLEVEYNLLENSECDFVFSAYTCIDEISKPLPYIDNITKDIMGDQLSRKVALNPSVIHHPTVMMRRCVFEAVGGYRNFPCAQDADLWLRLQEQGCKFYRCCKPLLRYRVNTQSVSRKNWFLQRLTWYYIYSLSLERMKKGKDSFSEEHYQRYLLLHGLGKQKEENCLRKNFRLLEKARVLKQPKRFLFRMIAFASHPLLRQFCLGSWKKVWLLDMRLRIRA